MTWIKPLRFPLKAMYNRYHAKILSFDDVQKIFQLDESVSVISEENKKIIPFKYAHDIIFNDPEHIVVIDCPCKKALPPYESVNCCIGVGKDLSDFWFEHCDKYNARKISQQEALELVKEFRSTGHVTQAFFKVATGGSTGVICNCLPESCISLQASEITRKINPDLKQSVSSGYAVQKNDDRCVSCGDCCEYCYYEAMTMKNGLVLYSFDHCMGCGLCVEQCASGALKLYPHEDKGVPLDMDKLGGNHLVEIKR